MKEFTLSLSKRYPLPVLFLFFVFSLLTGCGTMKQVQVVERVSRDTLYLNHIQYDSIYVYNQHSSDYHPSLQGGDGGRPDTVYVKDVQYEYKYKFLRDAVYRVQIDTIPVIREVEVVKTERYVPGIYKWSPGVCIGLIAIIIIRLILKIYFRK